MSSAVGARPSESEAAGDGRLVREIMTPGVKAAAPEDSLHDAAKRMLSNDCGALPVLEHGRLVGIITDRDIVVRAVSKGIDPDEAYVREMMSTGVASCYSDETVTDAACRMSASKVRRLPVLDRGERLVGIISLSDIAIMRGTDFAAAQALAEICQRDRRRR
ncbi:MAG: CBS domain-containing protein [Alphaproteobacteria bacterium]|nr:CBS domain-containing protein [Alphaproteobacteria bacterium]